MINSDTSTPSYLQLAAILRDKIINREYLPGTRLPATRELAEEYGLSYMTVRQGIKVLCEERYSYSVPGRGFFVRGDLNVNQRVIYVCTMKPCLSHSAASESYLKVIEGMSSSLEGSSYSLRQMIIGDLSEPFPPETRGVVIMGVDKDAVEGIVKLTKQANIPVVGFYSYESDHVTEVAVDLFLGGVIAAKHLLEKGCKKIGYAGRCTLPKVTPGHQAEGMLHEIRKHGVRENPDWICGSREDWWSFEIGYSQGMKILSQADRPDGIVAQTDRVAIGLLRAGMDLGLRCPEDFRVVGAGDESYGMYSVPRLTTVDLCHNEIGAKISEVLVSQIEDSQISVPSVHMMPRLIVRDSA